jgi:chromosome segregation ATPase
MSNTNDGLMKKTKKELVEIINNQNETITNQDVRIDNLKKDRDTYRNCAEKMQRECELAGQHAASVSDELVTLQKTIADERKKASYEYESIRKSLEEANKNVVQHQASIDELTSQKVEAEEAAKCFKDERDSARNWNYVLGIAVIIIAACWIIF